MNFEFFSCSAYLDGSVGMVEAIISREPDRWKEFELGQSLPIQKQVGSYLVPALPVEFHCHGLGKFNFSNLELFDLEEVNECAKREGILCVPSIFLPRDKLDMFVVLMHQYNEGRKTGRFFYIPGISLEGPMLASFGGTPEKGTWAPTKNEWKKIADCGALGLDYIVLSPDAMLGSSTIIGQMTTSHPNLEWIVSILSEAGIRLALGHFQKSDPEASAKYIEKALKVAHSYHSSPDAVLTDHLFNDMPLKIIHAFRSPEERLYRSRKLREQKLESWELGNLVDKLGPVPAVLIKAAHEGLLTICLNFDGEHVDLEICRRVVELVRPSGIIAMTDRTDVNLLGDLQLRKRKGSNLWYHERNMVAAGTSTIDQQIYNLRTIGFSEMDVWQMAAFNSYQVLGISDKLSLHYPNHLYSYVSETRQRTAFESQFPNVMLKA